MRPVEFHVNGRAIMAQVEPRQHLADFLREELLLTGTHLGCEHGVCGACTVLIDGVPARSCIAYAAALPGTAVTTIEGLADDPVMVRLRDAFSAEHGLQCGFCTPGMLVMARDIVLRRPGADPDTIRHELAGNLCRCTGYAGIVRAIKRVADAQVVAPTAALDASAAALASPLTLPVTPSRTVADPAGPPVLLAAAAGAPESTPPTQAAEPLRNPVTLVESFTLQAPRPAVWAFFGDPARVVACLPGARLSAPSDGRTLAAELTVKLGPIQATFGGTGTLSTDPAAWSGIIEGGGVDRRSATRVQARLLYRLEQDGPDATQVRVDVDYVLQGPLAQVSRGALARDLATRMTQQFAARVSAALTGAPEPAEAAPLDAGALVLAVVRGWFRRLFRRA